jgi:P27 family predicted phage terminase small subunit
VHPVHPGIMKKNAELAAPDHLSKRAQGLWQAIVSGYVLAPHQLELLRRACEASDRADEARDLLREEGLTVTDRYGQTKPHPAANIERDSRLAEARLIRELALAPEEPEDSRPPRAGTAATGRGR